MGATPKQQQLPTTLEAGEELVVDLHRQACRAIARLVLHISAPALRTCAGFRLHILFTKCETSCEGSDVRLTCHGEHSASVVCGCNSGHLDGPMQRFELSHTSGAFELPDHAIADNPDAPLDRIVSDTVPNLPAHASKVLRLGCAGCRLPHLRLLRFLSY